MAAMTGREQRCGIVQELLGKRVDLNPLHRRRTIPSP